MVAILLILLSIPSSLSEHLRGGTMALIGPLLEQVNAIKIYIITTPVYSDDPERSDLIRSHDERASQLEIENQALKTEVYKLQELFKHELYLIAQMTTLPPAAKAASANKLSQHQSDLQKIFDFQLESIPARVIYRSPAAWNSSLWINVGQADNEKIKRPIICKNSPVVVGTSIVGVIDYVGRHQSRVRLITDSGLPPSVRAARGQPQNQHILELIQLLQSSLAAKQELFSSRDEKAQLMTLFEQLKQSVQGKGEEWYLAKGEIYGRSLPLWRSPGQTLKGTGFNYDFSDNEGPARDLRSGQALIAPDTVPALPIIKEDDLLITTGLDGVFPPGLRVATVSKIDSLKEGDYFYEIEAKPTAGNLDTLSLVFVIPPVGYDPHDKAPLFGQ